jgi:hypothetical protein
MGFAACASFCHLGFPICRLGAALGSWAAALVGISSARKLARWQETAFEELRISPHEEIPEGTQRYLNEAAGAADAARA